MLQKIIELKIVLCYRDPILIIRYNIQTLSLTISINQQSHEQSNNLVSQLKILYAKLCRSKQMTTIQTLSMGWNCILGVAGLLSVLWHKKIIWMLVFIIMCRIYSSVLSIFFRKYNSIYFLHMLIHYINVNVGKCEPYKCLRKTLFIEWRTLYTPCCRSWLIVFDFFLFWSCICFPESSFCSKGWGEMTNDKCRISRQVYRYYTEGFYDIIATVAGIVQTVLYCDFFYLYITKGELLHHLLSV